MALAFIDIWPCDRAMGVLIDIDKRKVVTLLMFDVVVIGAGNIAANYDNPTDEYLLTHAHAISNSTHFNLVGFYDVNQEAARKAAEKWHCSWFHDMSTAISAANIICIAVPDIYHYSVLRQCLEQTGVEAVIVEKPYMATLSEAHNIQELLNKCSIPVILNYSRRFMPEFSELKRWITDVAGNLICGNCYYGKGTLHNGSHLIDIMRYFFGNLKVGQVIDKIVDFAPTDPSCDFYLYANNKKSRFYFHPIPCDRVTTFEFDLMFTNGRIRYSDEMGKFEYYEILKANPLFDEVNYIKRKEVKINPSNAMCGLYKNLYDVLANKRKPLCTEEDGVMVSCIVEEIYKQAGWVRNNE